MMSGMPALIPTDEELDLAAPQPEPGTPVFDQLLNERFWAMRHQPPIWVRLCGWLRGLGRG